MADIYAEQGMMRTQNGWVSLIDPKPEQIHLDDIIYALSNTSRFTGHSDISVLEHSCRAYLFACDMGVEDPRELLTVLMHDAHEAYVNDLSSPMKIAMRRASGKNRSLYDDLEHIMMVAVAEKFNLIYPHPACVREADVAALAAEVEILWGPLEVLNMGLDRQDRLATFAPGPTIKEFFKFVFNSLTARIENA